MPFALCLMSSVDQDYFLSSDDDVDTPRSGSKSSIREERSFSSIDSTDYRVSNPCHSCDILGWYALWRKHLVTVHLIVNDQYRCWCCCVYIIMVLFA